MSSDKSFSRRQFLKGFAASSLGAGALLGTGGLAAGAKVMGPSISSGKVKNFILMVSDGMNNGTFTAANHWLNIRENRDSAWMQLYKDGVATRGLSETACANSLITDSAAASSAWGIGERVNMRSVNVTPDGREPSPLALLAKAQGKSAGMVTTARITHATPAGFAANVPHRDQDPTIAVQYLERRLDVLLGGGDKHFNPDKREDGRDLYSDFRKSGYQVIKSKGELLKLGNDGTKPLLGVFSDDHMPYWIDRQNQKEIGEQNPSLEEMTAVALSRLSQNGNGFVLQIEAARVDHAAHANDPATIVTEQLEFDRTIALVREFVENRDDTLVVITSDHGTGGFMLCGADDGYQHSQGRFESLKNCRGSYEMIQKGMNAENPYESLIHSVEHYMNIQLDEGEKLSLHQALTKPTEIGLYSTPKNISAALQPILFKRFAVSWNCFNHTADLVEFAMMGAARDCLPGYIENWQVYHAVRDVMKI